MLGDYAYHTGRVVLEGIIKILNHEELQWVGETEMVVEASLEMIGTKFNCVFPDNMA